MGSRKWQGIVFSTNPDYMKQLEAENNTVETSTLSPDLQRLVVYRDTHMRKGKVVTIVEGFEGTSIDLDTLGKKLKTSCGVGGSAKNGLIIIQGDLKDRVLTLLHDLGYKKAKGK